ncbi:glycoside hydrolase family protein [Flavobacterium luteum]|uniref:Uncharacterized protein n=1 Tax=Flavobacterium luteum TaxID=2026654 RepID=A0A7J5A913_9FLAO|nr:hypothetical protein [Flavobacterium luteum]KAB1154017.1 hypothetical protein F6464_13595 [Flavobacterium luteum]
MKKEKNNSVLFSIVLILLLSLKMVAFHQSKASFSESNKYGLTKGGNKDKLNIYSAPKGIDSSIDFSVTVDGQMAFVFFMAENKFRKNYLPGANTTPLGEEKKTIKYARESWVSFEKETTALIRITQIEDSLSLNDLLLIDQKGNKVDFKIEDKTISFTAEMGSKYVLILNKDLSRRLTIFAEAPEVDIPDKNGVNTFLILPGTPRAEYEKTTKSTLYFAPGLHEMGDGFPLKPGLQIYLAPGAYVRGFFTCSPDANTAGASGVKIFGRGILSGENYQVTEGPNNNFLPRPLRFWSNSIYLGGFNREPADNQIVQGITIIYPSQQPIMGKGNNTLIENVKVINFEKGFGGICVGAQSKVTDCYISTDTRVLSTFGSNTSFIDNMIVGFEAIESPFYVGDRILDDLKNISVDNLTVIGEWKSLFSVNQVHFGNLSDFNFKNIKGIYTGKKSKASLLSLAVGFSPYRRGEYQGSISRVSLSDVQMTTLNPITSFTVNAFGLSEKASVRDVNVKNILVNGEPAKILKQIEQYAFNVTVDDKTIAAGKSPIAEDIKRDFPLVAAATNPAIAYARKDEDGDKYGSLIAHQIAYPNDKQKADPNYPKTLSAALGNNATGASLKGIKTIVVPDGDFLQTYAEVYDPRMYTLHSPDYELSVSQNSSGTKSSKVPVYENVGTLMSTRNRLVNPPPMLTEHFANFTHRGEVEVTVKMKYRCPDVKDVLIMPSQLNIKPIYSADHRSFTFTLASPHYLAIIVNGDWIRPLFVFGNPPEDPAPDPTDAAVLTIKTSDDFKTLENRKKLAKYRVINFAPGYHDIGFFFPVFSDQTIYIPGDAYVAGTILGVDRDKASNIAYGTKLITQNKSIFEYPAFKEGYRKKEDYVYVAASNKEKSTMIGAIKNFTIRGRGILSGEQMDWFVGLEDVPSYIILVDRNGKNGILEGLTFTGRHFHSANFFGSPALLSNVKTLFGFHGNTDASQWGMVRRNLFSIEQDDGTYIKTGLDIDGWFAWQQNNANVFCFVRTMPKDGETLGHSLIRNVTVIDGRYGQYGVSNLEKDYYNPMRGAFWLGINNDKNFNNFGYVADIVMQKITFETIVNPLFQFAPMTGSRFSKMIGIQDITFDNIQVPMGQNWKSIFGVRPETPDDFMRGIVIKDLIIGGKKIINFNDFARVRSEGRNLDVKIK